LEGYSPAGINNLAPAFRPKHEPATWVGMDAWVAAVCYNTVEAGKHNLPLPSSWKDLLDPVYRGHVIMPNPASSGTGFLDVSSWLQLFGEDGGWKYMDGLHKNIARYTHSGSKPCKLAAAGEIPIGISFAHRAAKSKNIGAPLEIIIPSEGVGWEMEATAIIKGTSKMEAAKTLIDWSVTRDANEMYNEGYAVVAISDIAKPVANFPSNIMDLLIDNDFAWAAANRGAILKQWTNRYDEKSDPK
ncbi:MAG: extracellular solute-binding protein, partial [Gammaproteobacteria bacterium]|nr:extracellular solute-binding protein [Gammaproteobacteria bacterium]